jgi:ADP-ribose pyrophosphatase YjhB (NUDIX family)
MKTRFKLIVSVYVFFIKDGKILLLRRANTGYEDGNYSLVAGHADGDEPLLLATVREAREESGVEIDPKDLVLKHTMHRRQDDERIDFFFEATKWQGELKNMELGKCDDLSWFPLDNLPDNTIPYIRQAIEGYKNSVFYSEYWKPTKIL